MIECKGNASADYEVPPVRPLSTELTAHDRLDHLQIRLGWRRGEHKVSPCLYAVGNPGPTSPVFISANYTLSFDKLRVALKGMDAFILALNTYGVNVWCAAGKGTFGTDELVERIEVTDLARVVSHRHLIVPQLGAPGVRAHEIKKRTGFTVEYGPVRADDIPAYMLSKGSAHDMRRVKFTLGDRAVLVPNEIVHYLPLTLAAGTACFLLGGWMLAIAVVSTIFAGFALFPLLLPLLPTRDFTTKGFFLGGAVTAGLILLNVFWAYPQAERWWLALSSGGYLLVWPPVTAFISLNFTGSSTFTSRTGVRVEMQKYLRWLVILFVPGVIITVVVNIVRLIG